MKFDFEKFKNHKKYDVFYDLIQEMQETMECNVFLKNAEEILTHIIGMFIDGSADLKHDIERLNQQEKLSDKTLKGFRNVYNDIKKIKPSGSLLNKQKDGILNGLNILCNWLLYRESISYMVPIKNNGKGSIAVKRLRDRTGTNKEKNTVNKKEIVKNIVPQVEADLKDETCVKEAAKNERKFLFEMQVEEFEELVKEAAKLDLCHFIERKYGIKEENFENHEEFLRKLYEMQDEEFEGYMDFLDSYIAGSSHIHNRHAYRSACIANWKHENGYHNYKEMIDKSIEENRLLYEERAAEEKRDFLEPLYDIEEDDDWRKYTILEGYY